MTVTQTKVKNSFAYFNAKGGFSVLLSFKTHLP